MEKNPSSYDSNSQINQTNESQEIKDELQDNYDEDRNSNHNSYNNNTSINNFYERNNSNESKKENKLSLLNLVRTNNSPSPSKFNPRASKLILDNLALKGILHKVENSDRDDDEVVQEKAKARVSKILSPDSPSKKRLSVKNKFVTITTLLKDSIIKYPGNNNPILNAISNHPSLQELYLSTYKGSLYRNDYTTVTDKLNSVSLEFNILKNKLNKISKEREIEDFSNKLNSNITKGNNFSHSKSNTLNIYFNNFLSKQDDKSFLSLEPKKPNPFLSKIKSEVRGNKLKSLLDDNIKKLYPLEKKEKHSEDSFYFKDRLLKDLTSVDSKNIRKHIPIKYI